MTAVPTVGADDQHAAFRQLRELIQEWREIGRITTTAGLKPAMQEALPGFSERDYGYASFRDFAVAAQESGWVKVMRQSNGHTLLGLPDETPEALERVALMQKTTETSAIIVATAATGNRMLKSDVWNVFVNWRADVRRMWDRQARHAFMCPVDEDGRPAWENHPERFVTIPPVTFDQQVVWMREWADTLPEPVRGQIHESLLNSAPKGAFRRELTRLGMNTQWRAVLQQRVSEHVARWAGQSGVPVEHVIDLRAANTAPTTPAVDEHPTPRQPEVAPRPPVGHPPVPPARPANDLERLRQRLHQVIDRMSLAELAALPIRAEHLMFD